MKRIWTMFLAVLMLCSALFVPAMAVNEPSIKVMVSAQEAMPGDELTAELIVSNNPGVAVMNFVISYDTTRLKLTGFESQLNGWMVGIGESKEKAIWVDENSWNGNGSCLKLKFRVLDDAAAGTASITISELDIADIDEAPITFSVTAGSVTVKQILVPATGISLNKSTTTIYTGANETLIATVEPNDTTDTVTWTSSNTAVATVDTNGKVTAAATGTATITATAGSQSASCVVTVENAPCTHTNKTNVDAKPSTCKEKGWEAYSKCDNCGKLFNKDGNEISAIPYLSLAAHKYTANEKKPEALKTAGTCKDKAIYLRSCEVCGKVAPSEAWGTFYGDTDPNNHAGGTTTVNASEPDHKNQVDGYTGDTKCLGCNEIIATGTTIPAGAHTPSSTWSSDETYHWKECAVQGCDVVIDSSKAEHSPTWKYNSTRHWHVCAVCGAKTDEPQDHQFDGGKTCVDCGYTKGSTIVILDPDDTDKLDLENPGTGAAVSGSSIGYACAALAAVGAIYVGAKKYAKKDEE